MSGYLIDTHCHLHDREFFTPTQTKEFLQNAEKAGVRQIICIGTDPDDSENAHKFATAHDNVYWTWGIHPEGAEKYADFDYHDAVAHGRNFAYDRNFIETSCSPVSANDVETADSRLHQLNNAEAADSQFCQLDNVETVDSKLGQLDKLVAIGEVGLDYHYDGYNRNAQIRLFEQMLQLAHDLNLPVLLHIREAFADAWSVLDNFPEVTGVVHSFTGSKKDLREALSRDFYIGINGLVTYTTPPLPPLEKIVLETDAPFLTPVPFRGTINQSAYVREIAAYLANKMGVAEVNIAEQTTKNARQLFKLGNANFR